MPPFRFKSFDVEHDRCAMKVGTDAILLGAWASAASPVSIFDVGTGSGVIALMLAQRFPAARIEAIEIDADAASQASQNFAASPWAHRMNVFNVALQDFDNNGERYDLVVSNPPYFDRSLKPRSKTRQNARHNDSLTHEDLLASVRRLMNSSGRFAVVLPTDRWLKFTQLAAEHSLQLQRRCTVKPLPSRTAHRQLLEFSRSADGATLEEDELVIETTHHEYSPEYAALVSNFLLRF